jgi:hypothetical protein
MSPNDGRSGCILFFYFQMEKKSFKKDYMLRFLGTNQRYIYATIDFFLDSKISFVSPYYLPSSMH